MNINDYIVYVDFSGSLSLEYCFSFFVEIIFLLFLIGFGC